MGGYAKVPRSLIAELTELAMEVKKSDDMATALEAGISVGKDEARKELQAKRNAWLADERITMSHKLLFDRVMEELGELLESWKLKTIPLEQAKQELDAEQLSEGSS